MTSLLRLSVFAALIAVFVQLPIARAEDLAAQTATLSVQFEGLRSSEGSVLYSLYNSADGFPQDASKAVRTGKVRAEKGNVEVNVSGLPPGTYALAFFHDENNNGKFDQNSFGVPTEGFGFSDNPQVTFSAPSFDDTKFELTAPGSHIDVTTKYF